MSVFGFGEMDPGGSVTLIFYKVGEKWWKEPLLNIVAAGTHANRCSLVNLSFSGSDRALFHVPSVDSVSNVFFYSRGVGNWRLRGCQGEMQNVCRVFNDAAGVELCSRTGRNPCAHKAT